MRVIVFGAGAIGSILGARLALAGEEVLLIARAPHAAAIGSGGYASRVCRRRPSRSGRSRSFPSRPTPTG